MQPATQSSLKNMAMKKNRNRMDTRKNKLCKGKTQNEIK